MRKQISLRSGSGTILRDLGLLMVAGMTLMILAMLPHINPPGENNQEDTVPPGVVMVEVFWDDGRNVDVDLWVRGPGDRPVGYSSKSGSLFNLLRDDLGEVNDLSGRNYENAYTRGIKPGLYVVNLHLYRSDGEGPVSCKVVVSVRDEFGKTKQIIVRDVTAGKVGEEQTAARFELGEGGAFTGFDTIRTPLREAR